MIGRSSVVALFAATTWSACLVTHDNPTNGRPPLGSCAVPMAVAYTDTFPTFHVLANAETTTPDLAQAYSIVSNGLGTYTLRWTNGTNAATCFSGRITGIDAFANIAGVSGFETLTSLSSKQIGFASAPGTYVDGVTFFEETDPIIVDVLIEGDETMNIYYTDGSQDVDGPTGVDPASFQSP